MSDLEKLDPETSHFEPDPSGVGYASQVNAYLPEHLLSSTRRRANAEVVRNRYHWNGTALLLTVRRESPREDFVDSDRYAVEIDVNYGNYQCRWQRAPEPEVVVDKMLSILS